MKPICHAIRTYGYPEFRLRWSPQPQGDEWEGPLGVRWAFVTNLPKYARGLQFNPDADGTDGLLDVCTFQAGGLPSGLRYLFHVGLGSHRHLHDCRTFQAARLRIEADEPTPFQLDGDAGGWLPVDIHVLPRRIKLVVPASFQRSVGGVPPRGGQLEK